MKRYTTCSISVGYSLCGRQAMSANVNVQVSDTAIDTLDTISRFNAAFNRHDVDAVMALMTDDCLFDNTFPPPDGRRFVGQAAVRDVWEDMFRPTPDASFETEEVFAAGDRCTARWIYRWTAPDGTRSE